MAPPESWVCLEAEVEPAESIFDVSTWVTSTWEIPSALRAIWARTVTRPCPTSIAAVSITAPSGVRRTLAWA